MTHKSVDGRKSMRERYILVAAIDSTIIEGAKDTCVAEMHKKLGSSATHGAQSRTRLSASDFSASISILHR